MEGDGGGRKLFGKGRKPHILKAVSLCRIYIISVPSLTFFFSYKCECCEYFLNDCVGEMIVSVILFLLILNPMLIGLFNWNDNDVDINNVIIHM